MGNDVVRQDRRHEFFRAEPGPSGSSDSRKQRIEIPLRVSRLLPQEGFGFVDADRTGSDDDANEPSSGPDYVVINGYQQIMLQRDPDLILQMGHYLAKRFRSTSGADAAIYAQAEVSYNTRKPQPLIDPDVNLAKVERAAFAPTPWIMPFEDTPRRRLDEGMHDLPPLPTSPPMPQGDDSDGPRYTTPEWE
jgi:hypothetical protein